jgi:hypothetical protein
MASLKHVVNLHSGYRDDIGDLVTRRPIPGPGLDHLRERSCSLITMVRRPMRPGTRDSLSVLTPAAASRP